MSTFTAVLSWRRIINWKPARQGLKAASTHRKALLNTTFPWKNIFWLVSNCQCDTAWVTWEERAWKIALIRLACGHVGELSSRLLIDVRGPSLLWAVSFPSRCAGAHQASWESWWEALLPGFSLCSCLRSCPGIPHQWMVTYKCEVKQTLSS